MLAASVTIHELVTRLRSRWGVLLLYSCAALAGYFEAIGGGFLLDDWWRLVEIKHGGILGTYTQWHGLFYRPLVSACMWLLWKLFGPNPLPFHLFNLVLLVLSGFLLYRVLRWWVPERPLVAVVAGLCFVLWPTHLEAVTWISGNADCLSVFFAVFALWAYTRYRFGGSFTFLMGTLLLLALSLLSKEVGATMVPILLLLGLAALPTLRGRLKDFLVEAALFAALAAAYVLLRKAAIGGVGGYGESHSRLVNFGERGPINLANAYFPFAKTFAAAAGMDALRVVVTLILAGMTALQLRRLPRIGPSGLSKKAVAALLVLGAARAVYLLLTPEQWTLWWPALLFLLPLSWLLARTQALTRNARALLRDPARSFALAAGLSVIVYWQQQGRLEQFLLLCAFLWSAYATRPVGNPATERVRLCLACVAASFLALSLTLNLPVSLSGEQSRFAYLASAFAVLAVALFASQYRTPRWMALAVPALLLVATFSYNRPWALAGQIAKSTTRTFGNIRGARRIYVLAAPARIYDAGLFLIGLPFVPDVAFDSKAEVQLAGTIGNLRPDDDVKALRVPGGYKLETVGRRDEPSFVASEKRDWFTFEPGGEIRLKGFDPKFDNVVIIGGTDAKMVD
jgi:hypothetical protein